MLVGGGQTGPGSPISRAIVAAVATASPVIITGSTPNDRNSVSSSAESPRGGSLNAMNPISSSACAWACRHGDRSVSGPRQLVHTRPRRLAASGARPSR